VGHQSPSLQVIAATVFGSRRSAKGGRKANLLARTNVASVHISIPFPHTCHLAHVVRSISIKHPLPFARAFVSPSSPYSSSFLVICDTPTLTIMPARVIVVGAGRESYNSPNVSKSRVLIASSLWPECRSYYLPKWRKCRPARQEQYGAAIPLASLFLADM
jgi:hypothetical protein